jgi:hypothetical protein
VRIFLSYRRDDASGHAGRLYDSLAARFGAENVFMDVDTIELGVDFAEVIAEAVASCDVLIALVGRRWLDAVDAEGGRRLDDPNDFVRLELEAALTRDVLVIPARVHGATQPTAQQLPDSLAPFARRQGTELRDAGWRDDVRRLIERLERLERGEAEAAPPAPASPQPRPRRRRRALLAGALMVAVAAAALGAFLLLRDSGDDPAGGGGGGAFPNALETQLLRSIPPITRPSCQRIDYGEEAAEVSLECSGVRTAVTYHLFADADLLDAWYVQRRELAGIEPNGGSCEPGAFRGEERDEAGPFLCYVDENEPELVWTQAANVGAEAEVWEGTGRPAEASLLRQWDCCFRLQP